MTRLNEKRWYYFDWDEYNAEKVWNHGISPEEAEQCFFNEYYIRPHPKKRYKDRYIIKGKTDGGRKLLVIFQDLRNSTARIITAYAKEY